LIGGDPVMALLFTSRRRRVRGLRCRFLAERRHGRGAMPAVERGL